MTHPRKKIRDYIGSLLTNNVQTGGTVFIERPSPAFIEEVPCVFVYIDRERVEVRYGNKYNPKKYERTLSVCVEIVTFEGLNKIDEVAEEIENLFSYDFFLGRMDAEFDGSKVEGLSEGVSLESVEPYEKVTESMSTLYGQKLTFNVPYIQSLDSTKKFKNFKIGAFDITKSDSTAQDPVLLSGLVEP